MKFYHCQSFLPVDNVKSALLYCGLSTQKENSQCTGKTTSATSLTHWIPAFWWHFFFLYDTSMKDVMKNTTSHKSPKQLLTVALQLKVLLYELYRLDFCSSFQSTWLQTGPELQFDSSPQCFFFFFGLFLFLWSLDTSCLWRVSESENNRPESLNLLFLLSGATRAHPVLCFCIYPSPLSNWVKSGDPGVERLVIRSDTCINVRNMLTGPF